MRRVAVLGWVVIVFVLGGCAGRTTTMPLPFKNPILTGDRSDPQIFLWRGKYYLTYTAPSGVPLLQSIDLIHWNLPRNVFAAAGTTGERPLLLNGRGFCNIWAPELFSVTEEKVLLLFSAVEYHEPNIPRSCPPFDGDTGIYAVTSATGVEGGFGTDPLEPLTIGVNPRCEKIGSYPHTQVRKKGCALGKCDQTFRIDGTYFRDGDHTYLAYTWFSNPKPRNQEEKKHHGFHISIVEMEKEHPERTLCEPSVHKISVISPGDTTLIKKLADYCPTCSERLSFSKTREGEDWNWNGTPAGIAEGPSLFRRGEYVYLLFSHAHYDSAYYGVSWVAAKTVTGLGESNPDRLVGRFLIPSGVYGFGHGSPLRDPAGMGWLYAYHRIDNKACLEGIGRRCERDLFLSPIEFEDRKDGRGDVCIVPRRPEGD